MKKTIVTLLLLTLALALVGPGAQATMATGNTWDQLLAETLRSVQNLDSSQTTLTVTGSSHVAVVPDVAVINLGVSTEQPEVKDAQDHVNQVIDNLIAALHELAIPEEDIATSNYNVYPVYDYTDGDARTLRGYQVSNQLTVTVTDFELINQVLDTAVEQGANEINGLTFEVSDQSTYYQQALAAAVSAGRTKAETLAQASGRSLGTLLEVVEETSGYSVYAEKAVMDTAARGANIQAGQTEITATVRLVYVLNPLN